MCMFFFAGLCICVFLRTIFFFLIFLFGGEFLRACVHGDMTKGCLFFVFFLREIPAARPVFHCPRRFRRLRSMVSMECRGIQVTVRSPSSPNATRNEWRNNGLESADFPASVTYLISVIPTGSSVCPCMQHGSERTNRASSFPDISKRDEAILRNVTKQIIVRS